MGLNFPASPAINDLYPVPAVPGLPQYKWDGTVWLANAGGGADGGDFLPLAGGQLTGNLGIGVPNDYPLQIGNGLNWNFVVSDWGTEQDTFKDGQYDGNWTYYGRARGTLSAPTKVQNGDALGGIAWIAADGTLPYPNICNITIDGRVDGPVSAGVVPCAMVFNTGTGAAGVERLRIGSDGKMKFVNPVPIVDADQVPTKLYVDNKVAAVPAGGRPQLTGARSWYIRTDGNDANDGSANDAAHAFATIQKAWDTLCKYDCNGFAVNLVCGAGMTFTAGLTTTNTVAPVNGFNITLDGGGSTIQTSFGPCVYHTAANVGLWIYNAILRPGIGGDCVSVSGRGVRCTIAGNITFGPAGSGASHVKVLNGAYCNLSNAYTVTGAATYHFNVGRQSMLEVNGVTVTLTASLAFNTFAVCDQLSLIIATTMTYTNGASITGIKHNIAANSVVYTGGSAFPGGTAGIVSTGGQYS
jgi:hypothetical protein